MVTLDRADRVEKTGNWIPFAACGGAVVLLMGIAGIGPIVRMMRKKKPPVEVARQAPRRRREEGELLLRTPNELRRGC